MTVKKVIQGVASLLKTLKSFHITQRVGQGGWAGAATFPPMASLYHPPHPNLGSSNLLEADLLSSCSHSSFAFLRLKPLL